MANLKDLIVNGSARVLGTLYANDIRNTDRVTEFIVGTQTATTGSWTGITKDDILYDGKNINYFLSQTGSGNATLNLTLSNGTTTGAKPVYLWGTSYVTTHYPINSCINMTYNATKGAWFVNADRDNNDFTRLQHSNNIKILTAISTSHTIICGTKDGYKPVASGVTFDVSYPILTFLGTANANSDSSAGYEAAPGINLQATKASWTSTANMMVYIVGTLSGTTFTVDSSVFTTTVPTSADNKAYIPIGILYSTYQVYFKPTGQIFAYIDGSFQPISTKYVQGSATQPIYFDSNGQPQNTTYTLGKSVPSDAVFTDTVYTHPTTSGNKHIPSGGSTGQILKYSADGTATWAAEYSYTHPTTSGNKHIPSGGASGKILKWSSDGTATWETEYSYTHPTTSGNKHIPSGGASGKILKWSADGTATWETEYSYTHPTTSGNKHIPSGGSSGQFLKWSSDGTATWAADNDTKNTAGSTDTSSKIFLVGATSQGANPQTYSHDTVFVDTSGRLNSAAPDTSANDTTVATTKWVKDQGYTTSGGALVPIYPVIETYIDGASWYRIWAVDDTGFSWCEQGSLNFVGSSIAGNREITLLKPFKDTNYNVQLTALHNVDGNAYTLYEKYNLRTVSSFTMRSATALTGYIWRAAGYISS